MKVQGIIYIYKKESIFYKSHQIFIFARRRQQITMKIKGVNFENFTASGGEDRRVMYDLSDDAIVAMAQTSEGGLKARFSERTVELRQGEKVIAKSTISLTYEQFAQLFSHLT
jgi:hypothetical protein